MPYQPDYAVPHTTIRAAELNAQFAALKAQLDAQATQITALQAQSTAQVALIAALQTALGQKPGAPEVQAIIAAQAARTVVGVGQLPPPWDQNPPGREELDAATTKINELIQGLGHPA